MPGRRRRRSCRAVRPGCPPRPGCRCRRDEDGLADVPVDPVAVGVGEGQVRLIGRAGMDRRIVGGAVAGIGGPIAVGIAGQGLGDRDLRLRGPAVGPLVGLLDLPRVVRAGKQEVGPGGGRGRDRRTAAGLLRLALLQLRLGHPSEAEVTGVLAGVEGEVEAELGCSGGGLAHVLDCRPDRDRGAGGGGRGRLGDERDDEVGPGLGEGRSAAAPTAANDRPARTKPNPLAEDLQPPQSLQIAATPSRCRPFDRKWRSAQMQVKWTIR